MRHVIIQTAAVVRIGIQRRVLVKRMRNRVRVPAQVVRVRRVQVRRVADQVEAAVQTDPIHLSHLIRLLRQVQPQQVQVRQAQARRVQVRQARPQQVQVLRVQVQRVPARRAQTALPVVQVQKAARAVHPQAVIQMLVLMKMEILELTVRTVQRVIRMESLEIVI